MRSVLSVSERALAGRTSGVAAVSASEEADIRTLTDRLRIIRLPHALDVSTEVRPRQSRSATVVCVGRLTYQKAPDTVLDLPQRLSDHGVPANCVWVGDGDLEMRGRLEHHGWTVTGWVDSSEVGRLVESAAALLHPARYEGFSLAVVEALSHGTPVIARRIPSNEELSGVRTFANTDQAVTLLCELLVRENVWDELSQEGVDYIERSHGWEAQTRALCQLYGEEAPV